MPQPSQPSGPSIESARTLAVLCVLGTGIFTYRVARELFDKPTAALTLLFWGLQHPFSQRCLLFNHNTVLMLTISAAVWCAIRAVRAPRSVGWWLALGCLSGLSLLAKYQAIVPLVGVMLAMWLSGEFRSASARLGIVLASAVTLAILTPHVGWVLQHHLSTLEYATQQGRSPAWAERGVNVVSFVAQQLRFLLPALVLGILLDHTTRRANPGIGLESPALAHRQRAWLIGLIAFPLVATLITAPALGLKLQNHWGYQALQFAGLFFAWRLRSHVAVASTSWLVLPLAVHGAFLALALHSQPVRRAMAKVGRTLAIRPSSSPMPFGKTGRTTRRAHTRSLLDHPLRRG